MIQRLSGHQKGPLKFGASELLLGLNVGESAEIEEAKINAKVGRTQQQFLACIGAIELEGKREPQSDIPVDNQLILLPWVDGVARLVLILELHDDVSISRASESIAESSINEHIRISFKETGAIKHLIRHLDHNSYAVSSAVTHALERLSVSLAK